MGYIGIIMYIRPGFSNLFLGEIILKLCDILWPLLAWSPESVVVRSGDLCTVLQ